MAAVEPIRVLELRSSTGAGGGPEKTILLGAQRAGERFEITVCYLRPAGDAAFSVAARGAEMGVQVVDLAERRALDLGAWRKLRSLVHDRRIDIVHAHDYKTDLYAWLLSRRESVVPLATAHGWTGDTWKERWVYYPADRRILTWFPRIIAVSSDIRDTLVKGGVRPERIKVLLNAIDSSAFRRDPSRRDELRQHYGLQPHEVAIGTIGRLELQKRLDMLLRSFAELRARHVKFRLLIAGEGGRRGELEGLASALGQQDNVRFLGHVTDVKGLHHALDLFVQASDYEGTPNAVLEALAMETPVVATAAGGTAELFRHGEHGLVVSLGDQEGLTQSIEQAILDPDGSRTRARAARSHVEENLDLERRLRAIESIYVELWDSRDELRHRRSLAARA